MPLLFFVLGLFSFFGIFCTLRIIYYELMFRKDPSSPTVFLAVERKHNDYHTDRQLTKSLKNDYLDTKEYLELLTFYGEYTGTNYKMAENSLKKVLKKYKAVARNFLNSQGYSKDSNIVKERMQELKKEVLRIQTITNTSPNHLKSLAKETVSNSYDNTEALEVHRDILSKCDKVRPYNHKAKPLRELSNSLIGVLNELNGKHGMEEARREVLRQLKELSRVLDKAVDDLPTYDSVSFVNNKLKINKNLLEDLKNTNYEDLLKIEVNKP